MISSPAVKDGKVFFDTSDTSLVVEADAKTGTVLHSMTLNHWYLYSSPAIAGGRMYVGSTQGKLVAIDLAGFSAAWSSETEGMKQHGPTYTKLGWNSEPGEGLSIRLLRRHGGRGGSGDEHGGDPGSAGSNWE